MLVLATVAWGFSFPLMKALPVAQRQLVPGAGDWFLAALAMALRFTMSALVMLALCGKSVRRLTLSEIKMGAGLGVFGGLGMLLQMAALNHTLASTSAFLTQFYALLIPISLALWWRRLPHWLVWASCLLVMAGMGVLCGVDWRAFRLGRGEWLTLLGSVAFTAQILWLDRKAFAECDKSRATLVMFATIAIMLAPGAFMAADKPSDLWTVTASPTVLIMLILLAVVCGVAAFYWMNVWQPQVHPTHAGLIYCAEPVFTSIYALFLPEWLGRLGGFTYANEHLTMSLWIGGALITLANVLIQFAPKQD